MPRGSASERGQHLEQIPASPELEIEGGPSLALVLALGAVMPIALLAGWLATSGVTLGAIAGPVLLVAVAAAVGGFVIGRRAESHSRRDLRQMVRALRRLVASDFGHVSPVLTSRETVEMSRLIERIGVRLEALQGALDHLEMESGYQLDQRDTKVESLESESERLRGEARLLHQFATAVTQTLEPAQICGQLLTYAERAIGCSWGATYLVEPVGRKITPVYVYDPERGVTRLTSYPREQLELASQAERSSVARAIETRRGVRFDGESETRLPRETRSGMMSLMVFPLLTKNRTLGAIEIAHESKLAFDGRDERILATLASQAATAIENSRLFEEATKVESLRELDRLKSEMLASVSHELRTPLQSIIGFSETLLQPDGDRPEQERQEFLQIILDQGRRLKSLVEDLLAMSKIAAGRLDISRRRLEIGPLSRKIIHRERLQSRKHTFLTRFPRDLPAVDADPKRTEQVIVNLVQNAIKYSPDGGQIRVRGMPATARPDGRFDFPGDSPNCVVVAVADEGIGIARDQMSQIFDRFFRVEGKASRSVDGSGLGLAICKGFVEAHGGKIWVESPGKLIRAGDPTRGSTFYFSLPIRDALADLRDRSDLAEEEENDGFTNGQSDTGTNGDLWDDVWVDANAERDGWAPADEGIDSARADAAGETSPVNDEPSGKASNHESLGDGSSDLVFSDQEEPDQEEPDQGESDQSALNRDVLEEKPVGGDEPSTGALRPGGAFASSSLVERLAMPGASGE